MFTPIISRLKAREPLHCSHDITGKSNWCRMIHSLKAIHLCRVLSGYYYRPTASATGGWGEKSLETENCQSSEQSPKNAPTPTSRVHYPGAVPGRCVGRFLARP